MFEHFSARLARPAASSASTTRSTCATACCTTSAPRCCGGEPIDLVHGPCQRHLAGRCQLGRAALPGARHHADEPPQRHGAARRSPCAGWPRRSAVASDAAPSFTGIEAPTGWLNNAARMVAEFGPPRVAARAHDRLDGGLAHARHARATASPPTTRCAMAASERERGGRAAMRMLKPGRCRGLVPAVGRGRLEPGGGRLAVDAGAGRGFGVRGADGTWIGSALALPLGPAVIAGSAWCW